MPGALEDIRVIDFTHALNGPFCTMMLGHMGAEIIKIEPPAGDGFRRSWMPPNSKIDGYEFLWINANKKSVVLNLKDPRGADLARQLIAQADVVVENYHTGTMEKFGLGYDDLKKINPRIIYSCSRGFGESGPYKDYGSTAHTNNSMTGWTHTGWNYSGAPGTKAIGIGHRVRTAQRRHEDPVAAILDEGQGKLLFRGKVVDVARRTTEGFLRGRAVIDGLDEDRGSRLEIAFQNEWVVAWRDGAPLAMSPDLICVLDTVSGEAFGTETIGYGRRVSVVALPAPPVFLTPKGLEHVGPRAFGYDLDFRSVFDPLPFPPPQAGER